MPGILFWRNDLKAKRGSSAAFINHQLRLVKNVTFTYTTTMITRQNFALPEAIQSDLVDLCRQNDVKQLSLFGSMARGDATAQSDIDLLVEFSKRKSLLAVIALERQFSSLLGKEVDLLTEAALSPYLRNRVKQEAQVLYVA